MHESALSSIKNEILTALSKEEQARLVSRLEPVELPHGLVLYEIGEPVRHVYFPNNALISLVTQMTDGKIVEVGLIGNDGMSGLTALMSEGTSPDRALVQIPNGGTRADLSVIKEEFMRGGQLQKSLLAYASKLLRQVSQTAAQCQSHGRRTTLALASNVPGPRQRI